MEEKDGSRVRGLMGLALRAGQARFGEGACLDALRSGRCGLLLLDETASPATRERYRRACANSGTPLRLLPDGLLHSATSKPGVAMALAPGGFAQQLLRLLPEGGAPPSPGEPGAHQGEPGTHQAEAPVQDSMHQIGKKRLKAGGVDVV